MSLDTPPVKAPNTQADLIIGCGYLGRRLAIRHLAQGKTVFGTTRNTNHAKQLAALGVRPLLLDVMQSLTFASLTPAIEAEVLDVFLTVPPSGIDGITQILDNLQQANVRQAIMVSSSAVYGQTDGQRVDADTPVHPTSERARRLMQAEQQWLDAGDGFSVLRLAGIYGPGRIIGEKALRQGAPIVGNPDALINLIHADDAVSLLLAMADHPGAARVELGCDGSPVKRIDYYQTLAMKLDLPAPKVLDHQTAAARFGLDASRLKSASSKVLDNTITRQRTGWSPAYPDIQAGLDTILRSPSNIKPQTTGHPC